MVFSVGDLVKVQSRHDAVGIVICVNDKTCRVVYFGKTIYGSQYAVTDNFDTIDLILVDSF